MFNFNHLYYFYIFAQLKSVSAAAQQLHISQPALSTQLKDLEEAMGRKLTQKEGRGLNLSPDGLFVFEYCRQIFSPAEDLWRMLQGKDSERSRRLHLGVSTDIDRPFLAETVSDFLRKSSSDMKHRVSLTSMSPKLIYERLKQKFFDAIVIDVPVYDTDICELAEVAMPVMLVYGKMSGVVPDSIDPSNLRAALSSLKLPWVLPAPETRLRIEIDRFLEKKKISPVIAFESDVLASVACAVAEGAGVSLLPKSYAIRFAAKDRVCAFGPRAGYWQHTLWLLTRKTKVRDSMLAILADSFCATASLE